MVDAFQVCRGKTAQPAPHRGHGPVDDGSDAPVSESLGLVQPRRSDHRSGVGVAWLQGSGGHHDGGVALGVTAEVPHDAIRLGRRHGRSPTRSTRMASQPDVPGGGNHHVGDHTTREAGHPVSQHPGRDITDRAEGFGEQRQCGRRPPIGSERDEASPRER